MEDTSRRNASPNIPGLKNSKQAREPSRGKDMSVITGNVSLTITALNSSSQNLLPANSPAVQAQNRNYPPQQNFPVTGTTLRSVAGLPIPQAGLAIALPYDGVSLLYVGLTPGAEFN